LDNGCYEIGDLSMLQRNYTIDAFRIIGAFCVVALHSPLGSLPNALALAVRLGSRWAVPYFFMVSGYFVAQKLRTTKSLNIIASINNLLAILIVANLLYCLFYIIDNNPATNIKLTFIGLLIGQSGHLWFIGSSILGLLMLQYLASRYSDKILLVVALGVLLFILVGDGYSSLLSITIQYEVARYLTSIPFLLFGFLLARQERLLAYLSVKACIAIAISGLAIEGAEAITLYKAFGAGPHNQELLVGTCLLAVGLFCLSLKFITVHENALSKAGKIYSLLIYLYHPIIISILFAKIELGHYNSYAYWVSPLLVFGSLLLLLKLIRRFSQPTFNVISGL
jgi:surface polysaccharide O-acyltransferase-like enzyme